MLILSNDLIFDMKPRLLWERRPPLKRPFCILSPMQEVEIGVEDGPEEQKSMEKYHFAMSGKSFAVITEHFQDLLQKVRSDTYSVYLCSAVALKVGSKGTRGSVKPSQGGLWWCFCPSRGNHSTILP